MYKQVGKFDNNYNLIEFIDYRDDILERKIIYQKNKIIFINYVNNITTITKRDLSMLYQEATINGKKYWQKFFYNSLNQGCKIVKSDGRCFYRIYYDEDLIDIVTKTGISYLVNPYAFNNYWSLENDKWNVFREHAKEITLMYGIEN